MREQVAVQFKQVFPVITLPTAMLLPYAVMPLTVTEPSCLSLVNNALDGSGQVALASIEDATCAENLATLRRVVCLGQIVQHEKTEGGYNLMVYGLCRAEIIQEISPNDDCNFRKVKLRPIEEDDLEDHHLEIYRVELLHYMFRPNMERLEANETIMEWIMGPDLSISALFEVVACTLFNDPAFRYTLLCEPSKETRCLLVLKELEKLDRAISMADKQPKNRGKNGTSLN
jgi:uncharacterized protein